MVKVLENWKFLRKLNIYLPYGPEFPLLHLYLREMKTNVYQAFCMRTLRATLFVIVRWEVVQMSLNMWMISPVEYLHAVEYS